MAITDTNIILVGNKPQDILLGASSSFIVQNISNSTVRFKVKGSIKRMEYGLTWSALTEAGGMVVGDEVAIMFNIELAKAK